MSKRLAWGIAAAVAYLAVAVSFAGRGPILPLYDSFQPPEPYRWLNPPPEFATGNQPPEPTRQDIDLTPQGSEAASIATPDGQAVVVVKAGTFPPAVGEKLVVITIEPLDPVRLGEAPKGLRYDGNAYDFEARYPSANTPATLSVPATIVQRAPTGGTKLLRRVGNRWTEVGAEAVAASLQVFGESPQLGTFVAAARVHGKPFPWLPVSIGASAVAAGAGWYAAAVIRKRRRRARAAARKRARAGPPGKGQARTKKRR